jgi:dTDP-L-rhamnose 4-epimerase
MQSNVEGEILESVPTDENSQIKPVSLYAITKYNQEQIVKIISESLGIDYIIFRFQNVYGPGQSLSNPYTGILSIFSTRMLNNNDINIFEDGLESRDFVFISDVINILTYSIDNMNIKNEIINVGTGIKTSVLKIAQLLKNNYKKDINIAVTGNFRVGDIRHNYADISKAEKLYNFKPRILIEKGIGLFCDWVLSQPIQIDKYDQSMNEIIK